MKPFEFKWKCMNVPIVARQKGGYDVIIASEMLGFYRLRILMKSKKNINVLSADKIWGTCKETIENSINAFIKKGMI